MNPLRGKVAVRFRLSLSVFSAPEIPIISLKPGIAKLEASER